MKDLLIFFTVPLIVSTLYLIISLAKGVRGGAVYFALLAFLGSLMSTVPISYFIATEPEKWPPLDLIFFFWGLIVGGGCVGRAGLKRGNSSGGLFLFVFLYIGARVMVFGGPFYNWAELRSSHAISEHLREAQSSGSEGNSSQVSVFTKALSNKDPYVRLGAVRRLRANEKSESADALVLALADEDARVRDYAAIGLYGIGPVAVPALSRAVKSEDERVRSRAERILDSIKKRLELVEAKGESPNKALVPPRAEETKSESP